MNLMKTPRKPSKTKRKKITLLISSNTNLKEHMTSLTTGCKICKIYYRFFNSVYYVIFCLNASQKRIGSSGEGATQREVSHFY